MKRKDFLRNLLFGVAAVLVPKLLMSRFDGSIGIQKKEASQPKWKEVASLTHKKRKDGESSYGSLSNREIINLKKYNFLYNKYHK